MTVGAEYLHASAGARQELVLLHGWGGNREVWRPLVACLRGWANITLLDIPGCASGVVASGADASGADASGAAIPSATPSMADCLEAITACAPPRAVYVGFSLGGQLAIELAARAPQRVAGIVTLCSNPCFVARADWPGMAAEDFEAFFASCVEEPDSALQRFNTLQVLGAPRPKNLLKALDCRAAHLADKRSAYDPIPSAGGARSTTETAPGSVGLLAGLNWLATLDQRQVLAALDVPRLHLFAEKDALVPVAVAQAVAALADDQDRLTLQTLPGCAHLAPAQAPEAIADELVAFLARHGLLPEAKALLTPVPKASVAQSFSRAAAAYDTAAHLQREVGEDLLSTLPPASEDIHTVVDLGCGTGHFSGLLAARYPRARQVGIDIAQGMVAFARERQDGAGQWLVADAEALPLASASADVIFSSLTLQWCYDLPLLISELHRVLTPGGKCVFTTLGPSTLCELRESWAEVDTHQHVNTFLPAAALSASAAAIPGIDLSIATKTYSLQYTRVRDLLHELKALGAHNMNSQQAAGLTPRRALQGMLRAYEQRRENGLLPATYEVYFAELEKQ